MRSCCSAQTPPCLSRYPFSFLCLSFHLPLAISVPHSSRDFAIISQQPAWSWHFLIAFGQENESQLGLAHTQGGPRHYICAQAGAAEARGAAHPGGGAGSRGSSAGEWAVVHTHQRSELQCIPFFGLICILSCCCGVDSAAWSGFWHMSPELHGSRQAAARSMSTAGTIHQGACTAGCVCDSIR